MGLNAEAVFGRTPRMKLVHSKWTFLGLQVMDVLTTLAAFHAGAYEVNPLVAHLTHEFGAVRGLIWSKAIAMVIVLPVRRLVWVANLFYAGVVLWNILVLLSLAAVRHH
jgi:hypothetical protein